tara:strand:- start:18 stop:227 length:210 start_codon:yes stop_codon:yes gene_type:complete
MLVKVALVVVEGVEDIPALARKIMVLLETLTPEVVEVAMDVLLDLLQMLVEMVDQVLSYLDIRYDSKSS